MKTPKQKFCSHRWKGTFVLTLFERLWVCRRCGLKSWRELWEEGQ
jgi:ribosomal protein S27AE